jgi:hypothetical protein
MIDGTDDVKLAVMVPEAPIAVKVDEPLQIKLEKLSQLLCRNCGNLGHPFCRMIFTEEQRTTIDERIRVQLDSRKLPKVPIVCKNCAEYGHRSCKKQFDEVEQLRITELLQFRRPPVKPAKVKGEKKVNLNLPPLVCRNCAELGHSYCKRKFSDMERVEIEELKGIRRSERAVILLKLQREKKAKQREDPKYREKELAYTHTESYRQSRDRTSERHGELTELLKRVSERTRLDPQRPEALMPLAELDRVAAEFDFSKHVRNSKDVFKDACPYLSYEWMTNNCCAVCGCDWPKAATSFHAVSDEVFMRRLTPRIILSKDRKLRFPPIVQAQYCQKAYDSRLDNLILCRYGLYTANKR